MTFDKLPNTRAPGARRRDRNEWLATDRREKRILFATIAGVAAILALGLWLVVTGLK